LKEAVVCDSSCLIALERIGHLDLLPALFDPVQAPPAIHQEFGGSPEWLRVEVQALRQEALRLAGE
jgi:predicted nucleic acid-binding protein